MLSFQSPSSRRLASGLVATALLVLAACDMPQPEESDFGQKAMERHYQNGDMNNYQYQTGSQVFKADPVAPGATDAAGTDKSAGTAKPASTGL